MVYAFIWRSAASQREFDQRVPALMEWLTQLYRQGRLRGCGGWADDQGGLTLVEAGSREEAEKIWKSCPLDEIGTTEIFEWDIFFAALSTPVPPPFH